MLFTFNKNSTPTQPSAPIISASPPALTNTQSTQNAYLNYGCYLFDFRMSAFQNVASGCGSCN